MQKKRLGTVIDDSALQYKSIFVGAGGCGLEIELAAAGLQWLVSGVLANIRE